MHDDEVTELIIMLIDVLNVNYKLNSIDLHVLSHQI